MTQHSSEMPIQIENLRKKALQWTAKEWRQGTEGLGAEEIAAIVELASLEYDPVNWREKLHALVHGLTDQQLEAAGKSMHVCQLLELLNSAFNKKNSIQKKLCSLFAGISPFLFRWLMIKAKEPQLKVLKEEAVTEVMQHHLTVLARQLALEIKAFCDNLEKEENEINSLSLNEMGTSEIDARFHKLQHLQEIGAYILSDAIAGLTLSWNTNRADLISQFGSVKETSHKAMIGTIGKPSAGQKLASGLWNVLEKKLASVFGDNLPQDSMEEPILEALVHFSVWYLHDYWEVGLLPDIDAEILKTLNEKTFEQELFSRREELFTKVNNNLAKLGLQSINDLKQARIYSKKALIDYVRVNQKKLEGV